MPRKKRQSLSDALIRSLKPQARPYPVTDGDGLFLLVNPSGAKAWRLTYYLNKKQKRLCLGAYPEVSLKRARELTAEARAHVEAGLDPCALKRAARAQEEIDSRNTFEAVAREWLAKKAPIGLNFTKGTKRGVWKKTSSPIWVQHEWLNCGRPII